MAHTPTNEKSPGRTARAAGLLLLREFKLEFLDDSPARWNDFKARVEKLWRSKGEATQPDLVRVVSALFVAIGRGETLEPEADDPRSGAQATQSSGEVAVSERKAAREWLARHGLTPLLGGRPRFDKTELNAAALVYIGALDVAVGLRGGKRVRERGENSSDASHIVEWFKQQVGSPPNAEGAARLERVLRVRPSVRALAAVNKVFGPYPARDTLFRHLVKSRKRLCDIIECEASAKRLRDLGAEVMIDLTLDQLSAAV